MVQRRTKREDPPRPNLSDVKELFDIVEILYNLGVPLPEGLAAPHALEDLCFAPMKAQGDDARAEAEAKFNNTYPVLLQRLWTLVNDDDFWESLPAHMTGSEDRIREAIIRQAGAIHEVLDKCARRRDPNHRFDELINSAVPGSIVDTDITSSVVRKQTHYAAVTIRTRLSEGYEKIELRRNLRRILQRVMTA